HAPTGLPAPPLPARPVGGRERHDHGTRRTSALPVADTRPEGYPAWQRGRYPSELCGPVVWRSRPVWIARHRTSRVELAGVLRESDSRPQDIRFAATIPD